ncbi:MAG TPA: hypothetical protein DIW81_18815 [Planctomycetaceae bacterium]|nr:hypothetical protein [Planctomycetaceae bacterium]
MLLQNAAFIPMFRDAMQSRGSIADLSIEKLQQSKIEDNFSVDRIFKDLGREPISAAAETYKFLQNNGSPQELIDTARLLVFLKGNDAHDYKFSSAVLEDFQHVSPEWRNFYLAANMPKMQHTQSRDNDLVQRTRDAFA